MPRLALLAVSLAALTACPADNRKSCLRPENMSNPECPDAAVHGGKCQNSDECAASTPSFPVCDLMDNGGTCVLCTATDHLLCKDMTPRCEGHECVGCVDDGDCGDKGVCLPAGDCADSSRIIHAVSAGGSVVPLTCGSAIDPCTLTAALAAVSTTRNVIRLDDSGAYTPTTPATTFAVTANVTIDANDAILERNTDGPVVTVVSSRTLTILRGTIRGATGSEGDGIQCSGKATLTIIGTNLNGNSDSAIQSKDCTLTITDSRVRGNDGIGLDVENGSVVLSRTWLTSNKQGGLRITNNATKFVVVANAFLGNGDDNNSHPVIDISTAFSPTNRLDFNTVARNTIQDGSIAGINCTAGPGFVARNNIIWNNIGSSAQLTGNCHYSYSDVGPDPVPASLGDGTNLNVNPGLLNETSDPHLTDASPALMADPGTDLSDPASKDIDGQRRVVPLEMGADELL